MPISTEYTEQQREDRLVLIQDLLKRRTWYEESLLVAEYHELCQDRYGKPDPADGNKTGWGMPDTATILGWSISSVLLALRLVKCCSADPTIAAHKTKAMAIQDMYLKYSWAGDGKLERRI